MGIRLNTTSSLEQENLSLKLLNTNQCTVFYCPLEGMCLQQINHQKIYSLPRGVLEADIR